MSLRTVTAFALILHISGCGADTETAGTWGGEPSAMESPAASSTAVKAVDVSLWSGVITDAEVACWASHGVTHVVAGTQNPRITRQQLAMAVAAGMTVDLYVYLHWDGDIPGRVADAVALAAEFPIGRIWLDAEDEPEGRTPAALHALLTDALSACGDFPCGIYTAAWWWDPAMGASTAFSNHPLWYAHYDNSPNTATWSWQSFGGWATPAAKQYDERYLCGIDVDLNTMELVPDAPKPSPAPPVLPDTSGAPGGLYPDGLIRIKTAAARLLCATVPEATAYAFQIEHFSGGGFHPYTTYQVNTNARRFSPAFADRVYRWRVRAKTQTGWGGWSAWALFEYGQPVEQVTQPPIEPDPQLEPEPEPDEDEPPPADPDVADAGDSSALSPADGASISTASVTLSCAPVAAAERYAFEIEVASEGGGFGAYYTYEPVHPTKAFWPAISQTTYRWRVRARINGVWGADSAWSTFDFDG